MAGGSSGTGGPWYAIGNVISNVISDQRNCNNYDVGALAYRNLGGFTAIYNTVYNSDMFVAIPNGSAPIVVRNNVFSTKNTTYNTCPGMGVDVAFTHDYNLFSSASDDPGNEANRKLEAAGSTFVSAPADLSLKSASLAKDNASPAEEPAFAVFQSRYGIDIRKDIFGGVRPYGTRWDIGAYEFRGGGISGQPKTPNIIQIQ